MRFGQFIRLQFENIRFVLGRMPTPDGRSNPPNLELGKMLIDHLEMIEAKTAGNLSQEETMFLAEVLKAARLSFVEASGGTPASMMPSSTGGMPGIPDDFDEAEEEEPAPPPQRQQPAAKAAPVSKAQPAGKAKAEPPPLSAAPAAPAAAATPPENKKKFTKNYG